MHLRLVLPAAAALLTVLLTGCTSAPEPAPTPTKATTAAPEPMPTATPTPTPVLTVDGLVLRPTVLEFRTQGEVTRTFDYLGDPAEPIAALTALFGRAPIDTAYPSTGHSPSGVEHVWGNVILFENLRVDRWADVPYSIASPRFVVRFTGPAETPVVMSSADGHQAGQPWSSVTDDPDSGIFACGGSPVELGDYSDLLGYGRTAVIARESVDGATIWFIGAPDLETTGCA